MTDTERIQAAQRGLRDRAKAALAASRRPGYSSQQAAALRGKARGYREAADMLESLLRVGIIHAKYRNEANNQ